MRTPIAIFLIALFMLPLVQNAENLKEVVDLEGSWKFSIGDDPLWSGVDYNDKDWDYVRVPDSWESNGFINYDGYAWYRKKFQIRKEINEEYLLLVLGYIDDVDEVYLNGHLVGASGVFPPLVRTAYNILRKYPVPKEILNLDGENVIAVRVYDEDHNGGITGGNIGIYIDEDNKLLSQNLAGYWEFETTNNYQQNAKPVYGKSEMALFVPGFWETQGYGEYDGSATYTKKFYLNQDIHVNNELMMVLGYIDDIDKVYLNGTKIGTVESINDDESSHYRTFRGYKIPEGLLNSTGENTLEVKVYDTGGLGGIYAGPVGIATDENFKILKRNQKTPPEHYWYDVFKNFWD